MASGKIGDHPLTDITIHGRRVSSIVGALLLVGLSAPVDATLFQDWAYELSPEAREIYAEKRILVPCAALGRLLETRDNTRVYVAIRDAGLFGDHSCAQHIERYRKALKGQPVVAFYRLKMGDWSQLGVLARSYDEFGTKVGDHETVDLFGFLDDWEVSGRRLVRHARIADGAAAELLCSALMWRRHLYGEAAFQANWFRLGREEKVSERALKHYAGGCRRSAEG